MNDIYLQNWDAFISLILFIPAAFALYWVISSSAVREVWKYWFSRKETFIIYFSVPTFLIVVGTYCFLYTSYNFSSTTLTILQNHENCGLLLLLVADLWIIFFIIFLSSSQFLLRWIRWRLKVNWRKRRNFIFERYRGLLRVFGRESRGGEETSLVLRTMKDITTDILNFHPSTNSQPYTGNELEPLLEDVVTILLDSPRQPTPADFRHAVRIFEAIFLYFRSHPRAIPSQTDRVSLEKPTSQRDLQAAAESIARLGQYIVDHLQDAAYDEELLRLLRLFQYCPHGERYFSHALRDVTVAMLWSPTHAYRLNYTVALQSLITLENLIRHISTKYTSREKQISKDYLEGQSEIFYDYLGVLAAFTKAGFSATNMALERWEKRRKQILTSYQNLLNLSFENLEAAEAHLWEAAIAHHRRTARFALADLLIETCKAWNIPVTPDKAQRAQATA